MADLRAAVVPNPSRTRFPGGFAGVTIPGNAQATQFAQSVNEILERRFGNRGSLAERAVTWHDLASAGIVTLLLGGGQVYEGVKDDGRFITPLPLPSRPEKPHLPTGLVGYGAETTVILTWDAPTYSGHAATEIYKSASSVLADAVLAGRSTSRVYADRIGAGASFYYWIRFVNEAGETGPFTAVGLQVTAGTASPGDQQTAYDLLVIDRGIIVEALIGEAEIGGAKIKTATIDSAKIISLAASKISAGALQVGSYIQSANYAPGVTGFRINADGSCEFNEVSIVGDLEAGSTITAPVISGGSITGASVSAGSVSGAAISGGTINGTTMTASTFRGNVYFSNDSSRWLDFDPASGGLYLNTPNAKIWQDGRTDFNNSVASGTWSTGLAASAQLWVRDDPGGGNSFAGA